MEQALIAASTGRFTPAPDLLPELESPPGQPPNRLPHTLLSNSSRQRCHVTASRVLHVPLRTRCARHSIACSARARHSFCTFCTCRYAHAGVGTC
eukprot:275085-Chlamydomonas_euryale.AAC.3